MKRLVTTIAAVALFQVSCAPLPPHVIIGRDGARPSRTIAVVPARHY